MINIILDSTSDLSPALEEKYGFHVVPLIVNLEDKTYKDGQDFTADDLFAAVSLSGRLPKTAAPSVGDFVQAFDRPGEVIFIGISSKLSATIQNAQTAAQEFEPGKVRVIDSLTLSSAIGLLAIHAAELRDQGHECAEIEQQILALRPKIRMSFVIDTLKYLYMGGRCSAIESLVGGLLHIRPIIAGQPDGTLGVKDKVRGSCKRALDTMVQDFTDNLPNVDLRHILITHTGCDEDAHYLTESLQARAPIEETLITRAGCVVSSHCGPRTIGILYLLK